MSEGLYRCVHCNHIARWARRREGTNEEILLCHSMQCLRDEWALEESIAAARDNAEIEEKRTQ